MYFVPCCIKICNGIDPDLQNIDSHKNFNGEIFPFIKIKLNSFFSVHNVYGVELLSQFRLNFSHLNEHKVCMVLKIELNLGAIVIATETILHFLLQCQQYHAIRLELLNSIYNLDPKIENLFNNKLLHSVLHGSKWYSFEINRWN